MTGDLSAPADLPFPPPTALPVPLEALPTPALLVERQVLLANLAAMRALADAAGVRLRPHFKTSKCPQVAALQRSHGAIGFTCATPAEVRAVLALGPTDVLWAHQPVGPAKVRFAVAAARHGVAVALDSVEAAAPLAAAADAAGVRLPYLIEIDSGLGRAGVDPDGAVALATALAAHRSLLPRGVMTHEGHLARHRADRAALEAAGARAGALLAEVAAALRVAGRPCEIVSVGSTPGATSAPFAAGVTEARPGTYVFHDANQVALGSAGWADCALTVLARVVSAQRDGTVITDAGSKAMSADPALDGHGFGAVPGQALTFLAANEEHGYLSGPGAASLKVGDLVRLVPNHACGTVNMWGAMYVVEGGRAVERWAVVARH